MRKRCKSKPLLCNLTPDELQLSWHNSTNPVYQKCLYILKCVVVVAVAIVDIVFVGQAAWAVIIVIIIIINVDV